jgi:hypothetical protein
MTDARAFLTVFFETLSWWAIVSMLSLSARRRFASGAIRWYSGSDASKRIASKEISPAVRILCERVSLRD